MNRAAEKLRFHVAGPEIVWPRAGAFPNVTPCAVFAQHRILAVSAEMTNVLASRCIDNQHASVAVTIGDIHPIGLRIHDHIGGPVKLWRTLDTPLCVVAVRSFCAGASHLGDELSPP